MQVIYHSSDRTLSPCVATIGFFDGVHQGHRALIAQVCRIASAKSLQSALVTFPIHPRKVMQTSFCPELLTTPNEKIKLLETTGVDHCFMLDFTPELSQLTAQAFMTEVLKKRYNVRCLVIGYDHRFGHNRTEGFDDYVGYGKEMGIEVVRAEALPFQEMPLETAQTDLTDRPTNSLVHVSSSLIRHLLQEGKVERASMGLGYAYFINGQVVSGYQMGRKIGFPTANIAVDHSDKILPANGVYAVYVDLDGKRYKGMLNIGVRPTLNNGPERSIEVHILHFNETIYDHTIRIEFVKRLREEQKFNSIEQLIAQLHRDAQCAETAL